MVAIVSGNTYGLSTSSASVLGDSGVFGNANTGNNRERAFVNIATGNLSLQDRDHFVSNWKVNVDVGRTYNSNGTFSEGHGANWKLGVLRQITNLTGTVNTAGSTVTRIDGDGAAVVYTYDTTHAAYVATDGGGAFQTITYTDNAAQEWIWRSDRKDVFGLHEVYDGTKNGRLRYVRDERGTSNHVYYYHSTGELAQINTYAGDRIIFDYSGGKISQIRTILNGSNTGVARVRYEYDGQGRLFKATTDLTPDDGSVTDGKVYTTTYTYHGTSSRIATVTQSDGAVLKFEYEQVGTQWKVSSSEDAKGLVTRYNYSVANQTTVTDPTGTQTTYGYDARGQLTSVMTTPSDGGLPQKTSYAYDELGNVKSVTDPGGTTTFEYDANGNRTVERRPGGHIIVRRYDSLSNQLLAESFATSTSTGDAYVITPNTTKRFIYDAGNRLRFEISAYGRVTEHLDDSNGNRMATLDYHGNFYNTSSLSPSENPILADLTQWVQTIPSRTQTTRTEYTWNGRGQLKSLTRFGETGNYRFGQVGTETSETYEYDHTGNLLLKTDKDGNATRYIYDGLGRLTSTINAKQETETTTYDDAGNRVIVQLANGLVRTSFYNKAGELLHVTESELRDGKSVELGKTTYTYDKAGRLRLTVGPTGAQHFRIYDAVGRLVGEIDADGTITEYVYDAANRLAKTTQYATPRMASMFGDNKELLDIPMDKLRPLPNGRDRSTWNTYDAAGRLDESVDALGYLTRHVYDNAGNLLSQMRSTSPIDLSTLAGATVPKKFKLPETFLFQTTRYLYDADGKLRGKLDAEGYLTEHVYDAAGRHVETITYAAPAPAADRESGTLERLRTLTGGAYARERYFYNGRGQRIATLSGDGYLSETFYNSVGLVSSTKHYGAKKLYSSTSALSSLRSGPHPDDRVREFKYDKLGRLISETTSEGVTSYDYDAAGKLISTTVGSSDASLIRRLARYDTRGNLIAQLSAEGAALLATALPGDVETIWKDHATKHAYDASNKLVSTTDQYGKRTVFYYDADGRLTHTVNPMGEVRRTVYNVFGQVESQTAYRARLSPAELGALTGGEAIGAFTTLVDSLAGTRDQVQRFFYDNRGQVVDTSDSAGLQFHTNYDANGNATSVTRSGDAAAGDMHAVSRSFYDANGRLSISVSGAGAVTAYQYDASGNVLERITYGKAVTRLATPDADLLEQIKALDFSDLATDQRQRFAYTERGQLKATYTALRHTALGQEWSVETRSYDTSGNLTGVTAYANAIRGDSPESVGLVASASDARTRYAYDSLNRLTATATASFGTGATRTWSVSGRVYNEAGDLVKTTAYATLAKGEDLSQSALQSFIDDAANNGNKSNAVTRYAYDKSHRVIGTATAQGVNELGQLTWAISATSYDRAGRVATQTEFATALASPAGENPTLAEYQAWIVQGPARNPDADRVTSFTYDNAGRVDSKTESGILLTRYVYDALGNVLTRTATAPGEVARLTRIVYDRNNRPAWEIDALGYATERVYDGAGNVVRLRRYATPLDAAKIGDASTPDDLAALTRNQLAQARAERFIVDQAGRTRFAIDAAGYVTEKTYDALGRVATSLVYAQANMLAKENTLAGAALEAAKHVAGARATSYTYDAQGNLTSTTDAHQKTEYYGYDALGRRTHLTNKLGSKDQDEAYTWKYTYDAAGRLLTESSPKVDVYGQESIGKRDWDQNRAAASASIVTSFTYDALGNVRTRTEAAGTDRARTTEYVYDAAGRQIETIHPEVPVYDPSALAEQRYEKADGAGKLTIKVTYNAFGEAIRSVSAAAKGDASMASISQKVYDKLGRVRLEMDGNGYITAYARDAFGNVTALTRYAEKFVPTTSLEAISPATLAVKRIVDEARTVVTVYDRLNRPVRVTEPSAFIFDAHSIKPSTYLTAARTTVTSYNGFGELETTSVFAADANGNPVTEEALTRNYYNLLGQLSETVTKAAAGKAYLTSYRYDAAGNLERKTEYSNAITTWGETVSAPTEDHALDRVSTYKYDNLNRRTTETVLGRVAADGSVSPDAVTKYEYDLLGNEIGVIHPDGSSSYTYRDALGRVIGVAKGSTNPQDVGQRFPYSEFRLDVHGNIVLRIDYANATDAKAGTKPVVVADSGNDRYTATRYDLNGHAVEMVDANGNVANTAYDVFGRAVKQWRIVTDRDGKEQTAFQITKYDAVGQATTLITPGNQDLTQSASAGTTVVTNVFNGFGELIQRDVSEVRDSGTITHSRFEYTDYDAAGRAWRTNAGDGVHKITLFDIQGNATSQIRSRDRADVDLLKNQVASPDQLITLNNLLRTDTRYDLLGHVVDVSTVEEIAVLRREPRTGSWEAVRYQPLLADEYLVVAGVADADKAVRVLYRVNASAEWMDTPARVSKLGDYRVFSTQGLPTGAYEYKVMLTPVGEPAFQSTHGKVYIDSRETDFKQHLTLRLYTTIFNSAPALAGANGLNYWIDRSNSGVPLGTIAQEMYAAAKLTGTKQSIVSAILANTFGRANSSDPKYTNDLWLWIGRFKDGEEGQAVLDMLSMPSLDADIAAAAKLRLEERNKAVFNYLVTQQGPDHATAQAIFVKAATDPAGAMKDAADFGALHRYQGQIAELYVTLFRRLPDHEGAAGWVEAMKGGSSIETVANQMLRSDEAREASLFPDGQTAEQFIDRLYATMLGRAAKPEEMTAWTKKLAGNPPQPAISRGLVAVQLAEQVASYSGRDQASRNERDLFNQKVAISITSAFVAKRTESQEIARAVLAAVVQRPTTQEGVSNAWASAQEALSNARAMLDSLTSTAAQNASATVAASRAMSVEELRLQVSRIYLAVLNRVPEHAGMEYWVDKLKSGATSLESFTDATIVDSEGALHHGGTSNAAFIATIYRYALGRTASTEDIAFWAPQIGAASRGTVTLRILSSFVQYSGPAAGEADLLYRFNQKAALGVTYAAYMGGNSLKNAKDLVSTFNSGGLQQALATASTAVLGEFAAIADTLKTASNDGVRTLGTLQNAVTAFVNATTAKNNAASAASSAAAKAVLRLGQFYVGLLNRGQPEDTTLKIPAGNPMDAAGLVYYADALLNGSGQEAGVAQAMIVSTEGQKFFSTTWDARVFVTQLYRQILRREPDAPGLSYWMSQATGPDKRGHVALEFIKSNVDHELPDGAQDKLAELKLQEDFNRKVSAALAAATSSADTGFRTASTDIQRAKDADAASTTAQGAVTSALNDLRYASSTTAAALDVARLYIGLLHRDATRSPALDIGGFNLYMKDRRDGMRPEEIARQFLASDEGIKLFGGLDNRGFIDKLYMQVLRRPVAAGDTYWLDQLNVYSRAKVAADMIYSVVNHTMADPLEYQARAAFDERVAAALSDSTFVSQARTAESNASRDFPAASDELRWAQDDLPVKERAYDNARTAADAARRALSSSSRGQLEDFYMVTGGYPGFNTYKWDTQRADVRSYIVSTVESIGGSFDNRASFYRNLYATLLNNRPVQQFEIDWWVNNGPSNRRDAASDFYNGAVSEARGTDWGRGRLSTAQTSISTDGQGYINTEQYALGAFQRAQQRVTDAQTAFNTAYLAYQRANGTPATAGSASALSARAGSAFRTAGTAMGTAQTTMSTAVRTIKDYTTRVSASPTFAFLDTARNWLGTIVVAGGQSTTHSAALGDFKVAKGSYLTAVAASAGVDGSPQQRVTQVAQLYRVLLGTVPTLGRLAVDLADLAGGMSLHALADKLIQRNQLGSANLSNDAFVTRLYDLGLGRGFAQDPLGLRYWSDQLGGSAPRSRAQLSLDFIASLTEKTINTDTQTFNNKILSSLLALASAAQNPNADEYTAAHTMEADEEARVFDAALAAATAASPRMRHASEVVQLFLILLNRAPDAAGFNVWMNSLAGGISMATAAQSIYDGFEARSRHPKGETNAEFINRLFQTAVKRSATAAEMSRYEAQLTAGQTKGEVVVNLLRDLLAPASGANTEVLLSRSMFVGRVFAALGETARRATEFAANMNGAVAAAGAIAQRTPADYATQAYLGMDAIASQAWVGPPTDGRTIDRWGNVLTITDPRNANWKIRYTYNANNQVTNEYRPKGYEKGEVHVQTVYDTMGRVVSVKDAMGYVNSKEYDRAGNLRFERHADGASTEYEVNAFGERTAVILGNGVRTEYGYDKLGNQTSRTSAVVDIHYAQAGSSSTSMARGRLVDKFHYDELGRRIVHETTDTSGSDHANKTSRSTFKYDLGGNVISTINAGLAEKISVYDSFNHKKREHTLVEVTSSTDPDGIETAPRGVQEWVVDAYGRVRWHSDLGTAQTRYRYNAAGQLVQQTGPNEDLEYFYDDPSGQLTKVVEKESALEHHAGSLLTTKQEQITSYQYDASGRRVSEKLTYGGSVVQNQFTVYDALGRIELIKSVMGEATYSHRYTYDDNGNRTGALTVSTIGAESDNTRVERTIDVTSSYDRMNRLKTVGGSVTTIKPPRLSPNPKLNEDYDPTQRITTVTAIVAHELTYDGAGNRETDTFNNVKETYRYDDAGRLMAIYKDGVRDAVGYRRYDGASRVVQTLDGGEVRTSVYDAAGRLASQRTTLEKDGSLRSDVIYSDSLGNSGYDGLGRLLNYRVESGSKTTHYTIDYKAFDSYKEAKVTATEGQTTRFSERQYDSRGNLVATQVQNANGSLSKQTFINDMNGQVLTKNKDGVQSYALIVNGEYIGSSDRHSESFSSVIDAVSSPALTAAPSIYTVAQGDTLQSIAKAVWGDATLWWLIADANGLTSVDADLTVGMTITIPTRANTIHNDFATFKPYDSAQAVGDTTPKLPVPPADKGCGVVGMIIMVVVAVVATVMTAGAFAAAAGSTLSATFSAGVSVFAGTSTLTAGAAFVAGAVGSAVGSIASQAVGIAMGMQDSFDWKTVALSALGGGVSAGLAAQGGILAGAGPVKTIGRAAVGATASQGIGRVLGLQDHFSWRNTAAAAAGAGVGMAVGGALGGLGSSPVAELTRRTLSGFAAGVTAQKISHGKVNYVQVATDAFGNALGNGIVDSLNPKENPFSISKKTLTGAEKLAQGSAGTSFAGYSAEFLRSQARKHVEDQIDAFGDYNKDPYLLTGSKDSAFRGRLGRPMDLVKRANEIAFRPQGAKIDPDDLKSVYAQLRGAQFDRNTTEEEKSYVTSAIRSIHQRGVTDNILSVDITAQMARDAAATPGGTSFRIANPQANNFLPRTSSAVARSTVGVPATRSENPLSPVLERDIHGNEIMYRSMSREQYLKFMETGKLPATTETSISPSLAYSSKYDGVTLRITTGAGTSAQLQSIGIAANRPAALQFPDMSMRTGSWMQTNARFKVERGQMTTQLGQGNALHIFNRGIVEFTQVSKKGN